MFENNRYGYSSDLDDSDYYDRQDYAENTEDDLGSDSENEENDKSQDHKDGDEAESWNDGNEADSSEQDSKEEMDLDLEEDVSDQLTEKCTSEYEGNKSAVGATYSPDEWRTIVHDFNLAKQCKLHNYPDMTPEEIQTALEKGEQAGEKIANALYPFVVFLAHHYYGTYFKKFGSDMIQEGYAGVFESITTYDPSKGKPTTWCSRTIIHNLRDFVDSTVHNTTPHYQTYIQKIKRFVAHRESAGIPWTMDDLAIELGTSPATLLACITIDRRNMLRVSTDQCIGGTNTKYGETISHNDNDPEKECIEMMQKEKINQDMSKCLTRQEYQVIWYKYGFDGTNEERSNAEVEKLTGIAKQDIRTVLNTATFKLRRYMSQNGNGYETEHRERTTQKTVTTEEELKKVLIAMRDMNSQYDLTSIIMDDYQA